MVDKLAEAMDFNPNEESDSDNEDLNEGDIHGKTMMHNAAEKGQTGIIRQLVKGGADVNAVGGTLHVTPLMLAVENGYTETTEVLLSLNADPSKMDKNKNLPLHYAAKGSSRDICEILLKKEPKHLDQANREGDAPIHVAARHNCTEVVKLLIGMKAKLSQPNNSGHTPLFIATDMGFPVVRKILVKKGAVLENKVSEADASAALMNLPDVPSGGQFNDDELEKRAQALKM